MGNTRAFPAENKYGAALLRGVVKNSFVIEYNLRVGRLLLLMLVLLLVLDHMSLSKFPVNVVPYVLLLAQIEKLGVGGSAAAQYYSLPSSSSNCFLYSVFCTLLYHFQLLKPHGSPLTVQALGGTP